MKKSSFNKKIVSYSLIASMALSLTGCAKEAVKENAKVYQSTQYAVDHSNTNNFLTHASQFKNLNCLQNEEEITDMIDFIASFEPKYEIANDITSIDSLETFESIVKDYYSACKEANVKPELASLITNKKLSQRVSESESICYELSNNKTNEVTLGNKYLEWFGENVIDGQTAINLDASASAPAIIILLEQYNVYGKEAEVKRAIQTEGPTVLVVNGNSNFSCPNSINILLNQKNEEVFETAYNAVETKITYQRGK